jgi:hypothetical protein
LHDTSDKTLNGFFFCLVCTKMYLKGLLDLLVSPLKLSSHDFVDHVAHGLKTENKMSSNCKKYKDDFFKNNINSANPFKYIFVHTRQKKNPFKVLSLVSCKNIACYAYKLIVSCKEATVSFLIFSGGYF